MIKKLYEQGFSDVKISKKLGISSKRVAEWRNVNNLPTQQEREHYKRLKLYRHGLSDKEIAEQCNVNITTIRNWRRERKMKANNGKDEKVDNRKTYTSCTKPLSESQRKVAKTFIKHLILAHKLNPSLDVSQFIKGYRDYLARKEKEAIV